MKRKNEFEFLTYWKISDLKDSEPSFLEDYSYEEIWDTDLTESLVKSFSNQKEFTLSFSPDNELEFKTLEGEVFHKVSVPELKKSSFLQRFLEYGEIGTAILFSETKIKGRDYNKMILKEQRGSDEDMVYIDHDCPKCGCLLEKPTYEYEDEPLTITCSNFDCTYIDDSKTDYSKNLKKFQKEVKDMKKNGFMEITGPTRDDFIASQEEEKEERTCDYCSGGTFIIENVFVKKEHGEKCATGLVSAIIATIVFIQNN